MADVIRVQPEIAVPPKDAKRSMTNLLIWAGLLGALAWSWEGADMRPGDLIADAANMSRTVITAGLGVRSDVKIP